MQQTYLTCLQEYHSRASTKILYIDRYIAVAIVLKTKTEQSFSNYCQFAECQSCKKIRVEDVKAIISAE